MENLLNLTTNYLQSMQIVDWSYTEESVPHTLQYYENWLQHSYHGPLSYMADDRKKLRQDLKYFYPDFQSALVFLFDYTAAAKTNQHKQEYKFAAYTKGFDGEDYHSWIKEKLEKICKQLEIQNYKLSIDAQPVLERDLAYKAGLGWFGKNSMLINRKHGSFFLISSILLSQKLSLNTKSIEMDHCGTCVRCVDACPTQAIVDNKVIDANKCISTFTIELFKETKAPEGYPTPRGEIFGCDICQEVCPWNHKPLQNAATISEVEFEKTFQNIDLHHISNREFKKIFKNTSLERTGRKGLLKNLKS